MDSEAAMSASILKKYPRPCQPPPYPGRSVIVNYDIDDPLHWKNVLDKKLDFVGAEKKAMFVRDGSEERSPSSSLLSGPIRPSPVATGAALTLAELKRKQLSKRQARLASTGNSPTQEGNDDDEEDLDSAEISLEERLKRLLEREDNEVEISVDSRPNSCLPEPKPPCRNPTFDGGQENNPASNDHNSFIHAPQASRSDQQQSPVRDDKSKFHVYGSTAPILRHSSSTRPTFPPTIQKNPGISLHNSTNKSAHPPNNLVRTGNYPSSTPPLSLENSPSGTSKSRGATPEHMTLRAHSSLRTEMYSVNQPDCGQYGLDFSEDETDEQRPPSSDEGFGGKHFESDSSTEDLARKQVLMMYDMQMELLRKLKRNKKQERVPKGVDNPKYLPLRKRCDSAPESEIRQRCEFLENHIASLARNIHHLTEEVHNQQEFIESMNARRPVINQDRTSNQGTMPRSAARRVPSSPKGHWPDIRSPQPPALVDPIVVSNPERVIKLTRFFGDEPPLVRLFLKKLGYEKYAPIFEREKIGSNELPYMTEDRLRRLGIPMGPRTRIMEEARLMSNKCNGVSSYDRTDLNYNLV